VGGVRSIQNRYYPLLLNGYCPELFPRRWSDLPASLTIWNRRRVYLTCNFGRRGYFRFTSTERKQAIPSDATACEIFRLLVTLTVAFKDNGLRNYSKSLH